MYKTTEKTLHDLLNESVDKFYPRLLKLLTIKYTDSKDPNTKYDVITGIAQFNGIIKAIGHTVPTKDIEKSDVIFTFRVNFKFDSEKKTRLISNKISHLNVKNAAHTCENSLTYITDQINLRLAPK